MANIPLDPEARSAIKHARLAWVRLIATGLLGAMAALLVLSVALQPRFPWLDWVEAFAEAALVGGLADWFAVTALFRHPLGLPIPHTAILPRNKDRLGVELGLFVEQNFLTPENILAKLTELDLLGQAAAWLAEPANSRIIAGAVRDYIPSVLAAVDNQPIEQFIGKAVASQIAKLDVAKLTGAVLGALTAGNRHQKILDQILGSVGIWLDDNRGMVKAKVGAQSRLTPGFFDGYIANRFVDGIIDLIGDIGTDPNHELRLAFDGFLAEFIDKLQSEPEYKEQAERIKTEVVQQLAFDKFFGRIWGEVKRRLTDDVGSDQSMVEQQIETALVRLGRQITSEPALLDRINTELFKLIERGLTRFRRQFATLIADVVQRWDAREISAKLELEVGRDLQFIRLNGTVVGGLAGLSLHAILVLLHLGNFGI